LSFIERLQYEVIYATFVHLVYMGFDAFLYILVTY